MYITYFRIFTYIHIYIYMYMCKYIYLYTYTHIHIYIYIHVWFAGDNDPTTLDTTEGTQSANSKQAAYSNIWALTVVRQQPMNGVWNLKNTCNVRASTFTTSQCFWFCCQKHWLVVNGSKWTRFLLQWELGSTDPRFHTYGVIVDCECSKHEIASILFLSWVVEPPLIH